MSKQKFFLWLCAALLLLGIAGSVWVLRAPHGTQVHIVQEGRVLYTFDLAVAEDQILEIEFEGRVNTVQIENGRIRMLAAECPDKTCVHMGWLRSGALPIVCLPNHLTIGFADANGHMDAVVQ